MVGNATIVEARGQGTRCHRTRSGHSARSGERSPSSPTPGRCSSSSARSSACGGSRGGATRRDLGFGAGRATAGDDGRLLAGGTAYREGGRTRSEYRLTPRGLDLWSLLVAIWWWERTWVPREVPLPELWHGAAPLPGRAGLRGVPGGGDGARHGHRAARSPRSRARCRGCTRAAAGARCAADPLSTFPGASEVIGDRWGTVVIASALLGVRTFAEFSRELSGVAGRAERPAAPLRRHGRARPGRRRLPAHRQGPGHVPDHGVGGGLGGAVVRAGGAPVGAADHAPGVRGGARPAPGLRDVRRAAGADGGGLRDPPPTASPPLP